MEGNLPAAIAKVFFVYDMAYSVNGHVLVRKKDLDNDVILIFRFVNEERQHSGSRYVLGLSADSPVSGGTMLGICSVGGNDFGTGIDPEIFSETCRVKGSISL